jgi:YVTN family beta-propeller protein
LLTTAAVEVAPTDIVVNPQTGYAYVASAYDRRTPILSGTQVITTLSVGSGYGRGFFGINPTNGYIYLLAQCYPLGDWDKHITIFSGTQVITSFDPEFGHCPEVVSVNPTNGYVYIGSSDYSKYQDPVDYLTILSGTQMITAVANIPVKAIAVNPVSGYVYVLSHGSTTVTVMSGARIVTSLPVGSNPSQIGVDPLTGYVYVVNTDSNDVTVISGTRVVKTLAVGYRPSAVAVDPERGLVYVTNHSGESVSIIQELVVPVSLTPYVLDEPASNLVIDFGEPVVTSTIRFQITPSLPFTVTWSPTSDRAIISPAHFTIGTHYTLYLLPAGQATSGLAVLAQGFEYIYLPVHLFLPILGR